MFAIQNYLCLSLFWISIKATNDTAPNFRIIGGESCSIRDYPFAVALKHYLTQEIFCGGILIHPLWLLTTAHCFDAVTLYETVVVAGITDATETGYKRTITKIVITPNYDEKRLINDLCVVQLNKPYRQSDLVNWAVLPILGVERRCEITTTLGWGFDQTETLHCLDLPLISINECKKFFLDYLTDSMLCTMVPEGGKDACFGDSGGPLICDGVVIGMVSKGIGCARAYSPGVYTKIDKFLVFIRTVLSRHGHSLSDKGLGERNASVKFSSKISRLLLILVIYVKINF